MSDISGIFNKKPFFLIAGPCVVQDRDTTFETAIFLKNLCLKLDIPLVFKSSYDKANRTSLLSFRGIGMSEALSILAEIKSSLQIPILTDVHEVCQVEAVAEVADIIQIPAFLCRQTDLLIASAKTGKYVNVKKGQFLAPWDVLNIIEKLKAHGPQKILLTERGTTFGYNNLVVDFRSLPIMRSYGYPVVFDATHSVQLPGGQGSSSGGQRQFVSYLAKAASAVGVDGFFMEVHPEPEQAPCDGPNMLALKDLESLLITLKKIALAMDTV